MSPAIPIECLTTSDEAALLRRAQAAEPPAFQSIVERYHARVLATIRGILHPTNDEDDVAQQVFVKAYFALGRFDGRSSLWTWLYRITVNDRPRAPRDGEPASRARLRGGAVSSAEGRPVPRAADAAARRGCCII